MLVQLLLAALCLPAVQAAEADAGPQAGRTLFGAGHTPLSWDSDELRTIRDLHSLNFDDRAHFTASPDIAAYLGLSPINALHLPVPVNVLFVGFAGDGNLGLEIRPAELQAWFEHLDHIIPHTRVPLSDLSCREDGHCSGLGDAGRPRPLRSYVHFNVSCHAVEVSHEVLAVFEEAIGLFGRPMRRGAPRGVRQVDAVSMEALVDGFVEDLGLSKAYTVVVLNPAMDRSGAGYRYRAGLSKEEIDALTADPEMLRTLEKVSGQARWGKAGKSGASGFFGGWVRQYRPPGKFEVNNLEYESSMWARHARDWLSAERGRRKTMAEKLGSHSSLLGDLLLTRGLHGEADLAAMLATLRKNEAHRANQTAFGGLRVMEPEEGCLVDAWVGHRRWVFLDLSAMAADWGPWVGGDGVKVSQTLPSVRDHFASGEVWGGMASGDREDSTAHNEGLKAKLQDQKDAHVASVVNEYSGALRQAVSDASPDENRDGMFANVGHVPDEVLMRAELDVFEKFALEHCDGVVNPPEICADLKERVDVLMVEIHMLESSQGGTVTFDRHHSWDIFGHEEVLEEKDATPQARAKDMFLAHMAAIVSRAIQHVFIPPALAWSHQGIKEDTTTPYARHITFHLYLIKDNSRRTENTWQDFNLEDLKSELLGCKLGDQQIKFAVHRLQLTDDPTLASALASAVRSTQLEMGSHDMDGKAERVFFDSRELERVLGRRYVVTASSESGEMGPGRRKKMDQHASLEVPVFVISLDRDEPVFIDEHYIAKALKNMVVVVHNAQYRGQHPIGFVCNGLVVGQTLAAPVKAAVAAVYQHLGGLLPPHLGYSPAHGAISHDWLWSVGTHAFSLTSPGWKATQAQKDALHRSYLLDVLDSTISTVNRGIALIGEEATREEAFRQVSSMRGEMGGLLRSFTDLVEVWRRAVAELAMLNFEQAVTNIGDAERHAQQFLELAEQLKLGLHPLKCAPTSRLALGVAEELVGCVVLVAAALLVFALLPKVKKSKLY